MEKTDKRTQNHITGAKRENEVFSLLKAFHDSGLIIEEPIHTGGRMNNYDILINNKKVEIKDNATKIDELPEILQIGCSSINPDYITFHYEQVINKLLPDTITQEEYMKGINNVKHEGKFKIIYEQRNEIESLTKQTIINYIDSMNEKEVVDLLIPRLKEQIDKTFILYSNGEYYFDRINDDFDEFSVVKNKNRLIIKTQKWNYYCLLRWKNGIGVNYPAWQISSKRNQELTDEQLTDEQLTKHEQLDIQSQSIKLSLTRDEMKDFGIFFTPQDIVKQCFVDIGKFIDWNEVKTICEPSCGMGVFIDNLPTNKSIVAYELNNNVFSSVIFKYSEHQQTKESLKIQILNQDYLTSNIDEKFDLIIGNPPYFVTKNKMYKEYYNGRPNIFVQFIIHSLLKLSINGILCFVIPSTFLNCLYYSKTREFIKRKYEILDIHTNPNTFQDTKYSTITLIIRKPNTQYNFDENNKWFYNDVIVLNQDLKTLLSMDYMRIKDFENINVNVGSYVWNQHKSDLSPIENDLSLPILIYHPNDVKRRSFVSNAEYKHIHNNPVIVINRGYGQGNYKYDFELIDEKLYPNGFICENHLLVIESDIDTLKTIFYLLGTTKTKQFVNLYITNGAMSVSEFMNNILLFED